MSPSLRNSDWVVYCKDPFALTLFGRRPHQHVHSLVMPATENLHNRRHLLFDYVVSDCENAGWNCETERFCGF